MKRAALMGIAATVRAKLSLALQCREEFRNWQAVVLRVGVSHLGWSHGVFTVSSREGLTLQAPNHRMSWWPLVEVLADDAYGLRDIYWEDPDAPRVVLDIGAHVGSFTCALAARLAGARFVCVEPSPSTLGWLRGNLAQNGLSQRAQIVSAAVAEADGAAELWTPEDASCAASLTPGEGQQVTVRTMSFDAVVAAAGGRADIVKLDCEGGEYAAVLDGSSDAWAMVEQLFLEYHPITGRRFEELSGRLRECGLHLVWQRTFPRLPGQGLAYFVRGRHMTPSGPRRKFGTQEEGPSIKGDEC
ncbi:MAG: FkbM family methyltransferase [Candidatus Dormibacteria bacterium]|nr:FkbM family methyltransferase [Candidatus Dormibacteraeota bacterium]